MEHGRETADFVIASDHKDLIVYASSMDMRARRSSFGGIEDDVNRAWS